MNQPPASILAIMAHPDDAELWAGATLAAAAHAGATITLALPHHGTPRDAEAAAGAHILGANLSLIDTVTPDSVRGLLLHLRPEVLITHSPNDIHADHRTIADAVSTALPGAVITTGHPRRVYTCDSYNNLDRHGYPVHLPTVIDATTTWNIKIRALTAHASQPIDDHFGPMAHTLGQLHGSRIGTTYAEAFTPIPILGRLPSRPWP